MSSAPNLFLLFESIRMGKPDARHYPDKKRFAVDWAPGLKKSVAEKSTMDPTDLASPDPAKAGRQRMANDSQFAESAAANQSDVARKR